MHTQLQFASHFSLSLSYLQVLQADEFEQAQSAAQLGTQTLQATAAAELGVMADLQHAFASVQIKEGAAIR